MTRQESRESSTPSARLEHDEVLSALRDELNGMPEQMQCMLALHFGGGLSQQEVGEALQIPRRTVSHQIEECLKALRTRLTESGFAAAGSLVTAGGLSEAICSGHPVPPYLHARILRRIASQGGEALASLSSRAVAVKSGGAAMLWSVALALGAVLLGGALFYSHNAPPAPAAQTTDAVLTKFEALPIPAVAAADPVASAPLHLQWSFENGPAQDLKILQANWNWQRNPPSSIGCMAAPAKEAVIVALPIKRLAEPLVIKVKAQLSRQGEWSMGAYWMKDQQIVPHRCWSKFLNLRKTALPFRNAFSFYLLDRFIVVQCEDQVYVVREHPAPYPADTLALVFKLWNIETIEVRSLAPEAVPAHLKDVPLLIKQLGVQPLEVRKDGKEFPLKLDPASK